jgi:hypothetical protein
MASQLFGFPLPAATPLHGAGRLGGTGKTTLLLSRHFWKGAAVASGGAGCLPRCFYGVRRAASRARPARLHPDRGEGYEGGWRRCCAASNVLMLELPMSLTPSWANVQRCTL